MECGDYDVPEKMKKLYLEKKKQRAAAREYYLDILYNPHRPHGAEPVIDPILQRFSAMSAYHVEYFKPKASTLGFGLLTLTPLLILFWYKHRTTLQKEQRYRSGVVSYHDREYKFMY